MKRDEYSDRGWGGRWQTSLHESDATQGGTSGACGPAETGQWLWTQGAGPLSTIEQRTEEEEKHENQTKKGNKIASALPSHRTGSSVNVASSSRQRPSRLHC